MARKTPRERIGYSKALRIAARKLKPVLDELREYDLKHGT